MPTARMLANSVRLALPRITAPARRSSAVTVASRRALAPSRASDPAVVACRSPVAMLSFSKIGMPSSGRGFRRGVSSFSAMAIASGFTSRTELSNGPPRSMDSIRARYARASAEAVISRPASAVRNCSIVAFSMATMKPSGCGAIERMDRRRHKPPTSFRYNSASVAPSVLNSNTRLSGPRRSASRASGSDDAARNPPRPAAPDSPEMMPAAASIRIAAIACRSGIAMKAKAARSSSCHASKLGSPQARPAINVSSAPSIATGAPARALASRQAARSGSTTTSNGAGEYRARNCTETAAAAPPTPAWMKTWVGGLPSQVDRLVGHQPVALHHVDRHRGVARPRGVGDHQPALGRGDVGGGAHRVVVGAGHAPDLGAESGDRLGAGFADRFVDEDHAAAAEALTRPRRLRGHGCRRWRR